MTKPTALVTGGASGVGLAFAERWIEEGGVVGIIDLDRDRVDSAIHSLGGGDVALGATADVTSDEEVRAAVESLVTSMDGVLDAVVNCAGIARPAPAATVADHQWTQLVDIHLNGTMRVNRACYEALARSSRPAIVNISSVAAVSGMPGRSSYCAAKAGVEGLTKALAVEWAPDGIRVNAVAPGYVDSAMTKGLVQAGSLDLDPIVRRTPLKRLADPAEISSAIFFLASREASFITGHTLYVDGGMTIDGDWY